MTKIYVLIDAVSGEDFDCDDPTLLLVTTDYEKAKATFNKEVKDWEAGMTNFDSNIDEYPYGGFEYECTDFEGDSHRIMKLVMEVLD